MAKINILKSDSRCWQKKVRRGKTYSLILGVQTDMASMEVGVEVPPKLQTILPEDTAIALSCVYPRNLHLTTEIHVHPRSLLLYS